MEIGDSCMNDWQCKTGYCPPGPPAPNSTCQAKLKIGDECDFFRAWTACETGTSGIWRRSSNAKARCCPTIDQGDYLAEGYCKNMPDGEDCSLDWQCTSGYCNGVCTTKQGTGVAMTWHRGGSGCTSGASGVWNDLGEDKEQYCCPTKHWANLPGQIKGMCKNLPDRAGCVVNWQCESNNCQNQWTAKGVCVEKKDAFDSAEWNDPGQCKSGAAGWWSTASRNDETRCCPTEKVQNDWGMGYCVDIPSEGQCSKSYQCTSKNCERGTCT